MPNSLVRYNRYSPYARALAAGVGIAYRNRRVVRDLAQGLRRTFDSFRSGKAVDQPAAKRQKVAMPVTAGATNVIQRAVVKQRSGRRVRKKSLKYLYKLSKAVSSSGIQRWQAMTPYDNDGALAIGYNSDVDSPTTYRYPCYLFDVTSCRLNVNGTAVAASPMYRLYSDTAGDFKWETVSGVGPDNVANTAWFTEMGRGSDVLTNPLNMGFFGLLNWSDIRLALYGAKAQTTRFTVSFIQFIDEVYHPRSSRENPAPGATYTSTVQNQQGRFNAAMEELMKPLVFHPLHSAGNADNVFRVLESRTFNVQPDTSTNEAKAAPNVCFKHFKRFNRLCKWAWQTTDDLAVTTATDNKLEPEKPDGLDNFPKYNQFMGGTKKPYVHPNARIYMMITAQAYIRTGKQPDGITNVEIDITNTPKFDIQVRNKWTYDAV